jgi:membrane peptidoglycan carboxypeptidase
VAKRRRDSVIEALADVGDLTRAQARAFERVPIETAPRKSQVTLRAGVAPHAIEAIRQEAIRRFGEQVVYGGGLVIHTTIDLDRQRDAEAAVASVLDRPDDPQAALVAVDPSGAIRAYVGGRDYRKLEVDLAAGSAGGGSGRQAGSGFKPVVLATALERGVATLGTTYPGPAELTLDAGGTPWKVGNYGGEQFGTIDLATATAHSVNTAYAQLMLDTGPANAVDTALALGVESHLAPNPSLVLGTGEVSVVDMADVYSTFARDGRHVEPFLIASVADRHGRTLYEAHPDQGQGVSSGTARAVTRALEGVIERGTGTGADLGRPAAGKTGTTQNNGDAWFNGYTPDLTASVWMGYPEGPQHQMDDVHGRAVTGGSFPAQIWKAFMTKALAGVPPHDFPDPPADLLEPKRAPSQPRSTTAPPTTAPGSTTTTTTEPSSTTTTTTTKGKDKKGGPGPGPGPKPKDTTTTAAPTTVAPTTAPPTTAPPAEASATTAPAAPAT